MPRAYDDTEGGWAEIEAEQYGLSTGTLDVQLFDRTASSSWKVAHGDEAKEGYFAIGIVNAKNPTNNGTLWRSAYQLGAAYTFTVGARWEGSRDIDTSESWRHVPQFAYDDVGSMLAGTPRGTQLVAIEMGGTPLVEFEHPLRAIYILGAEV